MSEAAAFLTLLLVVIWPLLLAGAMAFRATRPAALRLAPWAALPALILAVFAPPPPGISLRLPWLLLGTELGLVDDTGRLFLLFTALLWWLGGMYARAYVSDDRYRFFAYFLLSMSGNLGLILAQDLAGFYLFFALMSFASYGLVVHERSVEALRAGRVYIVLVVIGEVALFTALILATAAAGSTGFDAVRRELAQAESRDLIMFLAVVGFGIKAGVLGLHVWLPLAHPVAPTPASAVLSGAMIKAGLLGWLRLFPLGEVALSEWGDALMVLGLAAAFYGVVVGLTQRDPKTLLAYSSVSQMGILTMAVGLGLTAPDSYPAILTAITVYALHHGLSKGALFLGVGVVGACNTEQRRWAWIVLVAACTGDCGGTVDEWNGREGVAQGADGQCTRPLGLGVANALAPKRSGDDGAAWAVSYSTGPAGGGGIRPILARRPCLAVGAPGCVRAAAPLVGGAGGVRTVVARCGHREPLAGAAWRCAGAGRNLAERVSAQATCCVVDE